MATVNTMTIGSNLTQDWYGMYPSSHLFGIGSIDYSLNPGGYNWYPSNQQAIDPNGTFMVISDTVTDGITPSGSPYVATWHVASGTTSAAAAALYNRLPFTTNMAPVTNYDDARREIKIYNPQVLMYETNFTPLEFNYPNPQELKLNYDLGNLNCDIKHPIENRVWNISALTGNMLGLGLGFGYATTTNGTLNGSYRELDGFTYSGTYGAVVGAPVSNFAIVSDKGFAMNLRFKMEGVNSQRQTIFQLGSILTLETLGTATSLSLKWDDSNGHAGSLISNSYDFQATNGRWCSIWFGYDRSVDQMFLCVNHSGLGSPDIQTLAGAFTPSPNSWGNLVGQFFNLKNARVQLGAIQYWIGNTMPKVSNFNTIDAINASRWI